MEFKTKHYVVTRQIFTEKLRPGGMTVDDTFNHTSHDSYEDAYPFLEDAARNLTRLGFSVRLKKRTLQAFGRDREDNNQFILYRIHPVGEWEEA